MPTSFTVPPENWIENLVPISMIHFLLEWDENSELFKCGTSVELEVSWVVFERFQNKRIRLVEALRAGFDVEYNVRGVLCAHCKGLGGICEFNFSSSGPYTTCHQPQGTHHA
ncbi:hypothetical protein SLEP1_g33298 [Rubroshorea leprosula]|uniref:Wall-associated receptor kinase C-terminal domain-containing protein n=1 Tax=Rubroshorea leprosula TaxID=152421 RepID=A0AAV5KG64_9ROSI|nr:hypothetical protein SLEP1_g33298 [Rubroshorea leprosula]